MFLDFFLLVLFWVFGCFGFQWLACCRVSLHSLAAGFHTSSPPSPHEHFTPSSCMIHFLRFSSLHCFRFPRSLHNPFPSLPSLIILFRTHQNPRRAQAATSSFAARPRPLGLGLPSFPTVSFFLLLPAPFGFRRIFKPFPAPVSLSSLCIPSLPFWSATWAFRLGLSLLSFCLLHKIKTRLLG